MSSATVGPSNTTPAACNIKPFEMAKYVRMHLGNVRETYNIKHSSTFAKVVGTASGTFYNFGVGLRNGLAHCGNLGIRLVNFVGNSACSAGSSVKAAWNKCRGNRVNNKTEQQVNRERLANEAKARQSGMSDSLQPSRR